MLTYPLENRGETPLYEYLYRRIREDILSGKLSAGERLPSKRNLASHLHISVITVENAYAQLLLEGYIYSVEKRGYFVNDLLLENTASIPGNNQETSFSKNYLAADEHTQTAAKKQASPDEYLLDFVSNRILPENFPFALWSRLMRRVLSEQAAQLLEPVHFQGVFELRKAIAGHLRNFRGMEVYPEQVVVGSGTEYLYTLIIQLLGRNHIYGVENPGYHKIAQIYSSNGVACRWLPLDDRGLSIAALKQSDVDVIHISPGHHFPTGIVMPAPRRQELLAWAAQDESRYIIEDDYDSEFRFQGRPLPTLQSVDLQEKVIYMNTFSKTIAPSMRISYIILPMSLARRYCEKLNIYSCTVPSFEQYALARFLEDGYFEQHINRMRNFYRNQRNQIMQAIRNSRLSSRIQILEENAGLHFLLSVKTQMTDETLIARLKELGILVKSLNDYTYGAPNCYEHLLVVNYSGIRIDQLHKGIALLENSFFTE